MSIKLQVNKFQPQIQPKRPQKTEENTVNSEIDNNKCKTKETQPLPSEMATEKLEQEIAQAEQQLKAKLDNYVKILEQLGEPTFTRISNRSGNSAQITKGNPHVDGFVQLLNAQMPQKGSISAEEGVKILQDRLAQLNQALQDIDNDIREASFRILEQKNDAVNNSVNKSSVINGKIASSQAHFVSFGEYS